MTTKQPVKLVLIHPQLKNVISAATPDYVDENRGHTPPMGLLYIQAAVEQTRHESIFLDADLEGWSHQQAAQKALSHQPDIIGIQAMTFTLPDAYQLAKAVKKLNSQTKILIGGTHPTIFHKETAELDAVDISFAGEGEIGIPAFLDVFRQPDKWTSVPGIAYSHNGHVYSTPDAGLIKNLDMLAYPARASSKYMQYNSVLAERNPISIMITSRGCPFDCVFCNRMGRKYRYHSSQYVLGEMDAVHQLGIKEIFIHDDTFTLNRKRVVEICNGLIERNYDLVWEARTRVDCVDEELLSLMKKAGCHRLSFGVESGSEQVLKSMRKGIDIKRVENVFKWCKKVKIVTLADFMFGNLDEKMEDIKLSMNLAKRIKPDFVQYSICSPYPGTPLYEIGMNEGVIPKDVWLDFAKNPLQKFSSPVWTQNFSEQELVKITSSAYKSFYLRPGFVFKQLLQIKSFSQFATMLRAAIGMFAK